MTLFYFSTQFFFSYKVCITLHLFIQLFLQADFNFYWCAVLLNGLWSTLAPFPFLSPVLALGRISFSFASFWLQSLLRLVANILCPQNTHILLFSIVWAYWQTRTSTLLGFLCAHRIWCALQHQNAVTARHPAQPHVGECLLLLESSWIQFANSPSENKMNRQGKKIIKH